jgi:multisubunit Na+/H+ antiporter MnhB subunit
LKTLKIAILVAFAGLMIYAASDLPFRGDPNNAMHSEQSITGTTVVGNYFIQNAYRDAKTPNIVTVVLGDYRSIDTLGEQVVIFTAGMIALLILRRSRKD